MARTVKPNEYGVITSCPKDVKEAVIPAGVTAIGVGAFEGCSSLASVVIPESVTAIGYKAFDGCTSLSSVVIPEGVKKIGGYAFFRCKSLKSISLPSTLEEIGKDAFKGCKALSSVEFGGTKAEWDAVRGKNGLFLYVPATSVKCADGEWQKPIVLVEAGVAVKCLDKSAASVEIPAGVTEIGWGAFEDCKSLASVVIPESVTEIGKESFKGCNITELSHPCLTIKGGVAIKDGVAEYCASQAREIVIPDGVTEIGGYAFKGCKSLAAVEIPAGVTAIGRSAFSGCTSLASVVIPEGVTEIGDQAFGGCTALASVEFGGTVAQWEAVEKGDDWHGGVPAKSVKCADGEWQKLVVHVENAVALECLDRNATSVTIPEGVTEIGKQAFWFCESLSSVVIPSSVTEIGKQAFEGCESLSSVEFGGTMAQWKSVKKGIFAWDNDAPATTVKCSDGEARL